MSYRYAPDLVRLIAQLPRRDLADLAAVRAAVAETAAAIPVDTSGVDVTEHRTPDGVKVRLYRPERAASPPYGAILHAHGGGFVMCDLESSHARNTELSRELGVPLVSVDYRLAPEHPFPAALEDTYAALRWLAAEAPSLGADPDRIALHGTSAGAGLVAGLALQNRDDGGPVPCFQYLGIPMLDDRMRTGSSRQFTDTPMWDAGKAATSWNAYLGSVVPGSPDVSHYAAPARATDLAGLPPAYISVMEFDPLRDEGIGYAQALLAAGVPVELHVFPGTFHGAAMAAPDAAIVQRERAEEIAVLAAALAMKRPFQDSGEERE
ncbi:alpha/beta hydrolase [Trebonia kvetii]|uniref:Alpha/beta hydrolase n=1 Tax=Trebonia kvetii TaxID=2480626 RepID=A0A6P2BSZ5_9ACTN|nr:alpha/beta hydrolase [Trebonia kvetii]TVZ02219.1 alpha/beta hydrolase [Trebonia kvetii]